MTHLLAISKALIALGCIPELGLSEADTNRDVYGHTYLPRIIQRSPATTRLAFAEKELKDAKRGVECEDKFREFKAVVAKLEGEK